MRRTLSIICIIFLIGITSAVPYYSTSYFVYADDNTLTEQQRTTLAISTYFNYRKGFYVGSTASAVGVMNSYITEWFNSSSNNTNIKSYSDFVSHISVSKNDRGRWKVTLDNEGVVFLDNLCKWLLGKDKFPNLKSGGSWGTGDTSVDNIYNGYTTNNYNYYDVKYNGTFNISNRYIYVFNLDDVEIGNPTAGLTGDILVQSYVSDRGITMSDFNKPKSNSDIYLSTPEVTKTINYFSDVQLTYKVMRNYLTSSDLVKNSMPALIFNNNEGRTIINVGSNMPVNNTTAQYYIGATMYADRVNRIRGNFAYLNVIDGNTNHLYCGRVSVDYTNSMIYLQALRTITVNSEVVKADVNFNTDNFDKNDVGISDTNGDPVADSPNIDFIPRYTDNDGNTYNYYNDETINNFYNRYINNYTTETYNNYSKTVIVKDDSNDGNDPSNPSSSDPTQNTNNPYPLDPSDPSNTPGGTVPDWTGNGDSGTITPDGNGGYTFQLPDFSLPDLDINWSISGLTEKFPFSIPFDLYALFTVLNAEPETPEIHGEIPIWTYTWEIDWDLHQFDSIAALLRNLEFIAFCIGLAIITRNLIRG